MAEHVRTTPLRLQPNEHRTILFAGDLLMALASVFLALYTWRQYNLYVYQILYDRYISQNIIPRVARQLAESQTIFEVPFWFYVLPVLRVLLLVELYEPHKAGSVRKTIRGVAIAAIIGLIAYSVAFIIQQESNLPRIGVGAFLLYASATLHKKYNICNETDADEATIKFRAFISFKLYHPGTQKSETVKS